MKLTALLKKMSKRRAVRRISGFAAASALALSLMPALPCHAACHGAGMVFGSEGQEGQAPPARTYSVATTDAVPVFLGVFPQTLTEERAAELGIRERQGVYIVNTVSSSPADRGGLKKGDVIVEFDGKPVVNNEQFRDYLRKCEPGKAVTFEVIRDKKRQKVTVTPEKPEVARNYTFTVPRIGGTIDPETRRKQREELRRQIPAIVLPQVLGQVERLRALNMSGGPGRLGVRTQVLSEQLATYFGVSGGGVLVTEVVKGSAAEKAGIQAGDCIVKVGETPIKSPGSLSFELRRVEAGVVNVTVVRNKQTIVLSPTLEKISGLQLIPGPGREFKIFGEIPEVLEFSAEMPLFEMPAMPALPLLEMEGPDILFEAPTLMFEEGPVAVPVVPVPPAVRRELKPNRMPSLPAIPLSPPVVR